MTTAPQDLTSASPAAASPAVDDVTSLLPPREAALELLAERISLSDAEPATLLILGLLHPDGAQPIPHSMLTSVTSLLARSVRRDDWLASAGSAEFVVVLSGTETAAKTAAERLVRAVAAMAIPGLGATAGIAALSPGLSAEEVFGRATLSLTSARRVGPGTVIRYRAPL